MKLIKFKDVKLQGKFLYKSCLFIKGTDGSATNIGAKVPESFEDDTDVGLVVEEAHAPKPKTQPEPETESKD